MTLKQQIRLAILQSFNRPDIVLPGALKLEKPATEAVDAILALFKEATDEVIGGEGDWSLDDIFGDDRRNNYGYQEIEVLRNYNYGKNKLRAEQRARRDEIV